MFKKDQRHKKLPLVIDPNSEEGLKQQLDALQKENEVYKKLLSKE